MGLFKRKKKLPKGFKKFKKGSQEAKDHMAEIRGKKKKGKKKK